MKSIIAVDYSRNKKTGPVAATYAPRVTCPKWCPFYGSGCYGYSGNCAIHWRRLAAGARFKSYEKIVLEEASAIHDLPGYLPLRMHVLGDVLNPGGAEVLAFAARSYTRKHGQPVWTYTHAWQDAGGFKNIDADCWRGISVLASCETIGEAEKAMSYGYAASMVFATKVDLKKAGPRVIPCREQFSGVPCTQCGLCFRASELREKGKIIGFIPHGSGAKSVASAVRRKGA